MQISRPLDPIFVELAESISSYENAEDRLLSRTIHIPELQSLANDVLSQPSWSINESEIFELIQAAGNLDCELADWASNIPTAWSFSVAINLNSSGPELSSSSFIPSQIHRYPDFYIARVWNLYRVSRLVLQSILLRAAPWLSFPSKNDSQPLEYLHIEKVKRALVNDMCASVPFLLGYDLSKMKRPATNSAQDDSSIWPQNSMGKASTSGHTGRFSLIWPLYIACSVSSIPDIQRKWLRAQLRWIAELGEPQAKVVFDSESRTLSGEPETFRFGCS